MHARSHGEIEEERDDPKVSAPKIIGHFSLYYMDRVYKRPALSSHYLHPCPHPTHPRRILTQNMHYGDVRG